MLRVWLATSLLTWSFTFCVEDAQTYIFECIYLEYANEIDIFFIFFLNDDIVHVYVLLQINSESDEIQRFK